MVLVVVAPPEVAVVLAVAVVVVVLPPEAVPVPVPVPTAWLKRNSNVIKRKKGQLIEISFQVNSESFSWTTYSCGGVGCGIGSSSTSRGSSGFSSCSSCSGATSRGGSCTSACTNNVVEKEFDCRKKEKGPID